jgi:penicillin-binding protein 1A
MGIFGASHRAAATRPNPACKPPQGHRGLRLLASIVFHLTFVTGFALLCAFVYFTATIPDPLMLRQKESGLVVRILASDGSTLAERGGPAPYVPIDLLPRHLVHAVLAIEDRRFFSHYGVDFVGLGRAMLANLHAGRVVQGGSTITQQLAKNIILNSERTLWRKLAEVVLALWLETRLSKRDILELYLNRVYFGAGAYGVEAASRRFFDKSAGDLTMAEAAVLAGLLKAPSRYSPAWNPALARDRAKSVLAKMVEAGFVSQIEGQLNPVAEVRFAEPQVMRGETGVEYAVDAALEQLPALVAANEKEIVVETTIDANLQRRAQQIVHDLMAAEGRTLDATQAALVLLGMNGGVTALVGGVSYGDSQFNRALKAKRQPGSAFKPFIYLTALESGLTPDSIVRDAPVSAKGWRPRNFNGRYSGAVTLREALARSINTVAVRLAMTVGIRRTAETAHRLGIASELRPDATLALGTSEVTLLELTGAYGALASGGRLVEPHVVRRVKSGSGRVLYQRPSRAGSIVVAEQHAGALSDMLNAALVFGTGRGAALPLHPACGKTGTSQEFRDAWFIGYTAHFVAGVWVGNDDRRAMKRVMGGTLPARIWREVMALAHEGRTPTALPGTVPAEQVWPATVHPTAERTGPEIVGHAPRPFERR